MQKTSAVLDAYSKTDIPKKEPTFFGLIATVVKYRKEISSYSP